MSFRAQILMTASVTHDVKRFVVSRPEGFRFEPGQGVELAIDQPEWRQQGRPFTPTSSPEAGVLEFTIKRYPEHAAVTDALHTLRPGDGLLISEPFGTITYKGWGTFIAGGAGITPFLAQLRQLAEETRLADHRLIFSNKTPADVICEKELMGYLGEDCILTCTRGEAPGYYRQRVDRDFLQAHVPDLGQHFYICGPPQFTMDVKQALEELGASPQALVFEG